MGIKREWGWRKENIMMWGGGGEGRGRMQFQAGSKRSFGEGEDRTGPGKI